MNVFKVLATAFMVVAFAGCNPAKKAQRKLDESVQRVLTNADAFNDVGSKWAALHPMDFDTTGQDLPIQYLPGKRDTLRETIVIKNKTGPIDTVVHGVHIIIDTSGNMLVNVPVRQPDTAYKLRNIYVNDFRMLNNQRDTTEKYKGFWMRQQTATLQMQIERDQEARKKNKYLAILIGIVVVVTVYTIFKGKITGLFTTVIGKLFSK